MCKYTSQCGWTGFDTSPSLLPFPFCCTVPGTVKKRPQEPNKWIHIWDAKYFKKSGCRASLILASNIQFAHVQVLHPAMWWISSCRVEFLHVFLSLNTLEKAQVCVFRHLRNHFFCPSKSFTFCWKDLTRKLCKYLDVFLNPATLKDM